MAALAGMGITRVPVFEKPRVAIISTGNEIVPADTVPGPGQIRDSNSYNLEGLISQAGGIAVKKGILPDDYDRLRKALEEAAVGLPYHPLHRRKLGRHRGFHGTGH